MRTKGWWIPLSICLIWVVTGWGVTKAADANDGNAIKTGEQSLQKTDELMQLHEKDPNLLKTDFRKHEGKPFDKARDKWQPQAGQMPPMPPIGCNTPFGGPGPEMMHKWMQEKADEYMKCLKENYPDEATKLEELKKSSPEQFMRAMMISGKKYGRICQAVKDDPNLAKVLKEQLTMREKRAEILKQIKATTDEKQKNELTAELEQVVSRQFDLTIQRKQLEYEDLARKLADLQKEVDKRKAEVEKRKNADFKKQTVTQKVNELINDTEKFEWE